MKKALFFLMVAAMSFGCLMMACESTESEGGEGQTCRGWTPPCDPECVVGEETCVDGACVELIACDPECDIETQMCNWLTGSCEDLPEETDEPTEVVEPCDEGLVCDWVTGICEAEAEDGDVDGDEDGDVEPLAEGGLDEPCRTGDDEDPCDAGLVCEDAICVTEVVCVDDDCPGAGLCDENDDCVVMCLDAALGYNEDCPDAYGFMTEAYGDCEAVPCDDDADCLDLGNCDDPGKTSTKEFVCDTNSQCKRDI